MDDPNTAQATILLDGAPVVTVPVVGGQFEAQVNLNPEQNTIEAKTDSGVSNEVEVFLLPTISITPQGSPTQDGFAYVAGTVENSKRGTVKLGVKQADGLYGNAQDVQVANGRFESRIALEAPTILVKAFLEFDPPYGVVGSNEVSFTGTDTRVAIIQPADWTDSERDRVSGTIVGKGVDDITLLVNGVAQQPVKVKAGNRFISPVRLVVGENRIMAQRFASNTVTFERKQPVVTITSPKDGEPVFADAVPVTGTVENSRSKTVKLIINDRNERLVDLSSSGFASKVEQLEMGRNTVRAILPNAAPNEVTFMREKPPVVTIITPKAGEEISQDTISVSGKVENPRSTTIKLSVNGEDIPNDPGVSNGSFTSDNVKLKLGQNEISAWSPGFDRHTISVTFFPPPILKIEQPKHGMRTTNESIDVIGTVENSKVELVTITVKRRSGKQDTVQPKEVSPGKFEQKALNLDLGDNVISARIGKSLSNSVIVTRVEPPSITITVPSKRDKVPTFGDKTTIGGRITNPDGAKVVVDVKQGKEYHKSYGAVVTGKTFNAEVEFNREPKDQDTENTITVAIMGTDASDNVTVISSLSKVTVRVRTDTITILKPVRDKGTIQVSNTTAEIAGIVETTERGTTTANKEGRDITLTTTVNQPGGRPPLTRTQSVKAKPDGTFTATIRLEVGLNQVRAEIGEGPMRTGSEIKIIYKPPPPPSSTPRKPLRR